MSGVGRGLKAKGNKILPRGNTITNRFLADRYKCTGDDGGEICHSPMLSFLLRPIVKRKKNEKKKKEKKEKSDRKDNGSVI